MAEGHVIKIYHEVVVETNVKIVYYAKSVNVSPFYLRPIGHKSIA